MNIDLNQIEAMTTKDLEAHYGRLETEAFRLRVAISAVSLELEARIKSRRTTPLGVEETGANGDTRLGLWPSGRPRRTEPWPSGRPRRSDAGVPRAWGKCVCGQETCVECTGTLPVHCGEECDTCDEEAVERVARKSRSDKGTVREGVRAIDRSSCCGAEGRRMNTETLDCAACRGDAQ